MITFDTRELEGLGKTIEALGKLPKSCVSSGARKGANVVLKAAKSYAPRRTGNLRKGMKLLGEKSARSKPKKVYQITFKREMNDVFVKISKTGKRAYYPISVNAGFTTKRGVKTEGVHFLERAIEDNTESVKAAMLSGLTAAIDKAWAKKQLEGKEIK